MKLGHLTIELNAEQLRQRTVDSTAGDLLAKSGDWVVADGH